MIVLRLLGMIWALPVTLIGLLLWIYYGRRGGGVRWYDWGWETNVNRLIPSRMHGQTWGHIRFYRLREDSPRLRAHEAYHTRQCEVLGPLILVAYPVASLVAKLRGGNEHKDNWFELEATRASAHQPLLGKSD